MRDNIIINDLLNCETKPFSFGSDLFVCLFLFLSLSLSLSKKKVLHTVPDRLPRLKNEKLWRESVL
jgi:hypothetical protein